MEPSIVTQCLLTQHSLNIILSTAIVHVYDSNNEIHAACILLDSGSQINFTSQDLANKLYLKEYLVNIFISSVAQGTILAKDTINVRDSIGLPKA